MMDEENLSQEPETFEMTDSDGNTILVRELENFFYNGEEFLILGTVSEEENAEDAEQVDCFVVRVKPFTDENDEEMEELLPIEDAALEEKLIQIASTRLNEDDEEA